MSWDKTDVIVCSLISFLLGLLISGIYVVSVHRNIMEKECVSRDGVYVSSYDKCMSKEFFK